MSATIAVLAQYRARKQVKEMLRRKGYKVSPYTAAEIKVMANVWAAMHRDELIADAKAPSAAPISEPADIAETIRLAPSLVSIAPMTKLNGALRKIIDSPETQAQFKNIGFEGFSSTPEELGDFIKAQLALWGKMIKDANIQLD